MSKKTIETHKEEYFQNFVRDQLVGKTVDRVEFGTNKHSGREGLIRIIFSDGTTINTDQEKPYLTLYVPVGDTSGGHGFQGY